MERENRRIEEREFEKEFGGLLPPGKKWSSEEKKSLMFFLKMKREKAKRSKQKSEGKK